MSTIEFAFPVFQKLPKNKIQLTVRMNYDYTISAVISMNILAIATPEAHRNSVIEIY